MESPWMNAREAGRYLRRSRLFVLREVRAGRLKAARVGGRREILTRAEWCDAWVQQNAEPVMIRRRA